MLIISDSTQISNKTFSHYYSWLYTSHIFRIPIILLCLYCSKMLQYCYGTRKSCLRIVGYNHVKSCIVWNEQLLNFMTFEEMTAAQAEAEKAKAEEEKRQLEEAEAQRKAEEEAAQKAAEEAAAAAAAEEEAKGYETGITYDQLARTPDDYKGKW